MRDRRYEEMLRLGMYAEQRAFLTVMRWPVPFVVLPWFDLFPAAEPLREHEAFPLDQLSLADALREKVSA